MIDIIEKIIELHSSYDESSNSLIPARNINCPNFEIILSSRLHILHGSLCGLFQQNLDFEKQNGRQKENGNSKLHNNAI